MIRKPIPYGRQSINDDDIQAVISTLRSDYLTQGPKIKEFETKLAEYVGAKYAVAVNNATSGLHLATTVLGVKPGDNLMDIDKLRGILRSHPEGTFTGVIIVDFAGYPHNLEEYRKLCDEYGLWLIEDACHAPGAWFTDSKGVKQHSGNGNFADLSIFSFHPVKHIATGEGGMVTTNSPELYERLCHYRTHGITKDPSKLEKCDGGWYYEMQDLGFNYRLTDFQAALGITQLERADKGLRRRQQIAERYDEAFKNIPGIKTPSRRDDIYHAFHLYIIQVPDRKGLYDYLHENGVYAQVHYVPLHLMPYYRQRGNKKGDLPVVEAYYDHCLSLPMYPTLTDEEQDYVIEKVLEFVK